MSDLVLRPRSATELIDAAFQVYRRAPAAFMVSMALVYVPWLAIQLLLQIQVPETLDQFTPAFARELSLLGLVGLLIYAVAGGTIAIVTRSVYLDETADVGAALARSVSKVIPLVIATIVAWLLIVVGFVFLIVPGVYLIARFFALRQTVVLEDRGAFAALGRSGVLAKGQKFHILGTLILTGILVVVINGGAGLLIQLQHSQVITRVLATAVAIVVYPILSITETLLYYDTRIRNEGFDVEYLAGATTETAPTTGPVA